MTSDIYPHSGDADTDETETPKPTAPVRVRITDPMPPELQ